MKRPVVIAATLWVVTASLAAVSPLHAQVPPGGQPKEGSFIARAAPLPAMQPEVPSPRKDSCLRGVEGVHKVTHPFARQQEVSSTFAWTISLGTGTCTC